MNNFFKMILTILFLNNAFGGITIHRDLGMGIRGNGDSVMAHWGGMARLIEEYGPFGVMAGGSSSTLTIFMYESILLNPKVGCEHLKDKNEKEVCEKERLSLLIKSYEGMVEVTPDTKGLVVFKELQKSFHTAKKQLHTLLGNSEEALSEDGQSLVQKISAMGSLIIEIERIFNHAYEIVTKNEAASIFPNYTLLTNIKNALYAFSTWPTPNRFRKLKRTIFSLNKAFTVFGKFNAIKDDDLFVRPGLVSFRGFGTLVGKAANFYALYGDDSNYHQYLIRKMGEFLEHCAPNTLGLRWSEISKKEVKADSILGKTCGEYFRNLVIYYDRFQEKRIADGKKYKQRIHDNLGEMVPGFNPIISTSIMGHPESIKEWVSAKEQYDQGSPKTEWEWVPGFDKILYGYWSKKSDGGNPGAKEITEYLENLCRETKEFKACRSYHLGNAQWINILSLSPAEPGLARVQEFDKVYEGTLDEGKNAGMLSLGGWSDLMPHHVIRAAGAKKNIILTRRGYHSYFAQGVMMRLGLRSNITPDELNFLHKRKDATSPQDKNYQGSILEYDRNPKKRVKGGWTLGYNLHNPNSSYNKVLFEADAVMCTHWDWGSKNKWRDMILDSYQGILYINKESLLPKKNSHVSFIKPMSEETPETFDTTKGARYILTKGRAIDINSPWFNRGCTGIDKYQEHLPMHGSPLYPDASEKKSSVFIFK